MTTPEDLDKVKILWKHERSGPETTVNKNKWKSIPPVSWHEKAAAALSVASGASLLSLILPVPPRYFRTVRWFVIPTIPLLYHGLDALLVPIAKRWEYVERRLRYARRPQRIILIRHGQSQANLDGSIYEKVPDNQVELSEEGQRQAINAGRYLRMITGDETLKFYISPYKRSIQTYEGIIKGGEWPPHLSHVRQDPRLREQDWGNFQVKSEMERVQKERRTFGSFYYRMPNGESGADVFDRVTSLWDSIHREFDHKTEQNYVLITHGLTIRLFLMRYFQWNVEQFNQLWNPNNCDFAVLELGDGGRYRLWVDEDWENVKKMYKNRQ